MVFFTGIGGHRGMGCTDHDFYQPLRDIRHLPVENSLASLETALAAGADYVEMDAVMSADGVLFTLHNVVPKDHFFDAAAQPRGLLNTLPFDEIKKYKTGRFQRGGVTDIVAVLDMIAAKSPGTLPWKVNIEIKGVQGSGQPYETTDYLEKLSKAVRVSKMPAEQVLFSSFALQNVLCMTRLLPTAQYGMLFAEKPEARAIYADHADDRRYQYLPFDPATVQEVQDIWVAEAQKAARLAYVHPEVQTINPQMIPLIQRAGMGINCWALFETLTPERQQTYRDMLDMCQQNGVPMTIITDYIDPIRALTGRLS